MSKHSKSWDAGFTAGCILGAQGKQPNRFMFSTWGRGCYSGFKFQQYQVAQSIKRKALRSNSTDLLAERRGLVPTAAEGFFTSPGMKPSKGCTYRALPLYFKAIERYRLRFVLNMRLGRKDHYIGASGFAQWSINVHYRELERLFFSTPLRCG